MNIEKWNNYYINATEDHPPPWESNEVFHGLKEYIINSRVFNNEDIKHNHNAIELGCGASKSSIWLAKYFNTICGVDFSPKALDRAKKMLDSELVNWIEADLLNSNLFNDEILIRNGYDFVFDMQCFHVLRMLNEDAASQLVYDLLKPNGYAMIVTGALSEDEKPQYNSKIARSGPPLLTKEEILNPFLKLGLNLISITLSKFNQTIAYGCDDEIPKAWIAIFQKC